MSDGAILYAVNLALSLLLYFLNASSYRRTREKSYIVLSVMWLSCVLAWTFCLTHELKK